MSFHQTYELHPFEPGETYVGDTLDPSWQVSIYQSSMGDVLEECNFTVFLERLGGLSDTVKVHRVGFSGDGWYRTNWSTAIRLVAGERRAGDTTVVPEEATEGTMESSVRDQAQHSLAIELMPRNIFP